MKPDPQPLEFISLPRIARAFYFEPIAIEESAMLAVHSYLWPRITGQIEMPTTFSGPALGDPNSNKNSGVAAHTRRTMAAPITIGGGWSGTPLTVTDPRYYWSIDGRADVAVVPINGMIMKGASGFQEMCMGAVSTERVAHALNQAAAAKEITKVVLDIGSPGGQTTATPELGALIKSITAMRGKTVYAFTDSHAASAAYWLASQADEIIMTGSASVGSIGTYLAFLNPKIAMQMQGVSLELFKAGTHKGLGLPGNDLTQADREYLQGKVNDLNAQFLAAVKSGRTKASDHALSSAAMYPGISSTPAASAIKHGLADGIVSGWDEFISLL